MTVRKAAYALFAMSVALGYSLGLVLKKAVRYE